MTVTTEYNESYGLTAHLEKGGAGKYLTFILGDEEYGLDITKVKEIMGAMEITHLPRIPPFIKGVINLRGKIIPIIDLRLKFRMPEVDHTRETCFIVVEVGQAMMGIVVDTVREVLDIPEGDIEPAPVFGSRINADFILGMGKVQGKVKILLDIEKVLIGEEAELVTMLSEGFDGANALETLSHTSA